MDFLISTAFAQSAPSPQGGGSFLFMMVFFLVIFYFLLIRPQMKQAKDHKKLVESLGKGDEVVTNGGMLGRIAEVGDNFVLLEVAKDVQVKVQKQSIATILPKGTVKTL